MEKLTGTMWNAIQQELRSFVLSKVKDKTLTDDIVQDVFLKVQANFSRLKDVKKFSGWIYQITRNTIIDHYRSQSRSLQPVDLQWDDTRQDFNDCVAFCLGKLLTTLPDQYRQALQLIELENVSQLELAERLGISYSGAKSRVQRARQMLKQKMDALYIIETDAYGNVIVCRDRVPCQCRTAVECTPSQAVK
jgi:RNA polymerase sigma-70 factor (ECF subfamily)